MITRLRRAARTIRLAHEIRLGFDRKEIRRHGSYFNPLWSGISFDDGISKKRKEVLADGNSYLNDHMLSYGVSTWWQKQGVKTNNPWMFSLSPAGSRSHNTTASCRGSIARDLGQYGPLKESRDPRSLLDSKGLALSSLACIPMPLSALLSRLAGLGGAHEA